MPNKSFIKSMADVLLVALAGLLVTAVAAWAMQRSEYHQVSQVFKYDASTRAQAIERHAAVLERDMLLFQHLAQEVAIETPEDFTRLADPYLKNPLAIGWIIPVENAQRSAVEQRLSADQQRKVELSEVDQNHQLRPAQPRPLHYPLVFALSNAISNLPIGLDMISEGRRRDAIERAIHTRTLHVSVPLELGIKAGESTPGAMLLIPVARTAGSTLSGLAVSFVSFKKLLLIPDDATEEELFVTLYHRSGQSEKSVFSTMNSVLGNSAMLYRTTLAIANDRYSLDIRPSERYLERRLASPWRPTTLVGLTLTVLAMFYLLTLKTQRSRTLQLVDKRTRQLRDSTQQLTLALEHAQQLSITDQLTGLCNRRRLLERMQEEMLRLARYGHPVSVIMFDLDHFKAINDTFGHGVGDAVLVHTSDLLRERSRETDVCARWGGEEFMVLCPDTSLHEAIVLAEALRQAIASQKRSTNQAVTASFGVIEIQREDTETALLQRMDELLYAAKIAGRNCVRE